MIVVTGASGPLGRLAIEHLLARGVPAAELAAVVRDPAKAADLAAKGVQLRQADYDKPETLPAALAGADKLLLVSGNAIGQRVAQHTRVVEAAKTAGVGLIAYTSILRADSSGVGLAVEHLASENVVRDSGIPFVMLRNGWYLENYTEHLAPALEHGAWLGSAGTGRAAAAARTDYAEAAAVVLTTEGHSGKVYELAGDTSFDYSELAAEVAAQSGKTVVYRDLPSADHIAALTAAGVPQFMAELMADWDAGVARGDLEDDGKELHKLIGRDTTPLSEAVTAALK
ncbi:SDR family oxidoreductase [Stackebrandtia nassauensis]|uniref:NmrA family protein n=1 Tax=Stackebrandtia nassauensis (strain DSM 44728 / CIP 108903 / NRRL B-16338 / NBRC 102104 / LLR-40K-21) TaxID=446470 RepID=D3PZN8_STANL|nr:SDR family oxidoreductase [Stackebrandtia nassauensis]ADD43575.1 NmrA family protein [Stackebrandtia nassauensis DSM 44728]